MLESAPARTDELMSLRFVEANKRAVTVGARRLQGARSARAIGARRGVRDHGRAAFIPVWTPLAIRDGACRG
jgi:hypothetical protein